MFYVRHLKILLFFLLPIPTSYWASSVLAQSLPARGLRVLEAEGRVQAIHDDYDLLDGTVVVGERFVVRVTYEADVPPAEGIASDTTTYTQRQTSTVGMKIVMGERVFVTDPQRPFTLELRDGNPPDSFVVRGNLEIPADLQDVMWQKHAVKLSLVDDSGAVLDDTRIPTQLRLEDWSRASCRIAFVRSAQFTAVNYHPAVSIVISGDIERMGIVDAEDPLIR